MADNYGLIYAMLQQADQKAQQAQQNQLFQNILNLGIDSQNREQARLDRERQDELDRAARTKDIGQKGYQGVLGSTEAQLRGGLVNYGEAVKAVRDYQTKYGLDPNESDITNLTNVYQSEILPGRQKTGALSAYQDILGREATPEELKQSNERFAQGYYTSVDDLKNSLYKGKEYQDKFNTSYLDNYYDTMFGKQTVDAEGKKTGLRAYQFDKSLMPEYSGDLASRTKVKTPDFKDSVLKTPAGIEDERQNVRDTRQYLYSAGLTNLQGEIDKETQVLKNQGAKDIAKIEQGGGLYRQLVGAFSFS
jgi:hypothetical protein